MEQKKTYEDYIRELGLYVATPINLYVLFDAQEVAILSCLRHFENLHKPFISISTLKLMTGFSEKSIKKYLSRLKGMNFIEKGTTCKDGTHYSIKYTKLYKAVRELNAERNPYLRYDIANRYRGDEYKRTFDPVENYKKLLNN